MFGLGEQPKSSLWETAASAQGPQPQNDGWNQSDSWGQSLNNDAKWKSDGCGTSSGQKKPDYPSRKRSRSRSPHHNKNRYVGGSSKSPRGNLREFMDRGEKWREESPSPSNYGRNATREPCHDLRRGSWSNGKNKVCTSPRQSTPCSTREASQPDLDETRLGNEKSIHLLKADVSKRQGTSFWDNRTEVGNENQPGLLSPFIKPPGPNDDKKHGKWDPCSPLRCRSPHSQATQVIKKSSIDKESDGWGMKSSDAERSRSRSLSPWSQAARNVNDNSDSKGTIGWGKNLDQTGSDAWNMTKSSDHYPNDYSNGWKPGHNSASSLRKRSISIEEKWKRCEQGSSQSPEPKWIKTGYHLDRSRCRERSISAENRPSRTGRGRGRSRGRGIIDLRSHSRFNRHQGLSPNNNKTKAGREKHLGFSSPKRNCSDQNEKTASDGWDVASPNMDESRSRIMSGRSQAAQESMKNAKHKESDGWDRISSPLENSRSRSGSPWSRAAVEIDKNYNNKEIDGWGTALEQKGPDAWNQPRSNISVDHGSKRREGLQLRDRSLSPAPKWRRTGQDLNRSRGRDNSYSPDNKHRRSGWNWGGSRCRGRASSPRCQDSRERTYPSYPPSKSRNLQGSPSHVQRMDQDRERKDGLESKYDKKTNDGEDATKVTSWEGSKWHDWSVNTLRSSLKDQNLIFNWGHATSTGDGNYSGATRITTLPPELVPCSTRWTVSGVAGSNMDIEDAEQRGAAMGRAYSQDWQISIENHGDVKENVVENSQGIEQSMNGTPYLPLSYDPWDNDACIAPSNAMIGTLLVNPTSSQPLLNHQNTNLVSDLARNPFPSAPWSGSTNMLRESSCTTWGPSAAPFKYPTLEPKTNSATASSFLNCSETKSSLVPIGGGAPLMTVLKSPTTANGVNSITVPSASLAQENLPPLPTTDGTVSSSSSVPEAMFSNTNSATKIALLADTDVRTSCSRRTDTEAGLTSANPVGDMSVVPKVGMSKTNQNMVVARFSEENIDAIGQTVSCTTKVGTSRSRESDTKSESSAVGAVVPTSMVTQVGESQPNQNPITQNGRADGRRTGEADWVSISRALVNFAKPIVKQHWVNGLLTNANYREVLDKFWGSVYYSLGTAAPRTDENIQMFIQEENDSLSTHLQAVGNNKNPVHMFHRFASTSICLGRHKKI